MVNVLALSIVLTVLGAALLNGQVNVRKELAIRLDRPRLLITLRRSTVSTCLLRLIALLVWRTLNERDLHLRHGAVQAPTPPSVLLLVFTTNDAVGIPHPVSRGVLHRKKRGLLLLKATMTSPPGRSRPLLTNVWILG